MALRLFVYPYEVFSPFQRPIHGKDIIIYSVHTVITVRQSGESTGSEVEYCKYLYIGKVIPNKKNSKKIRREQV